MVRESNDAEHVVRRRAKRAAFVAYGAVALVSIVTTIAVFKLWQANLRVPLVYGGDSDAFSFQLLFKGIIENGWYLHNPQVGAPGALDIHDFPFADNFHLLIIKLLACFIRDSGLLFNLYYLMGYPLITLSAFAVLRHFEVSFGPALVASVLFAFLPRHMMAGEHHIFYATYFQIPLLVMVALWVSGDDPPLFRSRVGDKWPKLSLLERRSILALAICGISEFAGHYYAFFATCLMLVGGAWASVRRRSWENVCAALLLAGTVGIALIGSTSPTLLYRYRHGMNTTVSVRTPRDAEVYGLKIAQLLLPIDEHRVKKLANLKDSYNTNTPLLNESGAATLGILGSIGFLILLLRLFSERRDGWRYDLHRRLSLFNLTAVLLGTVGGFGALFALIVSPQIRTYTRICTVIGFLSLFALGLALQRLRDRYVKSASNRVAFAALLALMLVVGLLDQSTPQLVPHYAQAAIDYRSDHAFVGQIEATVPTGAMIFQLPYMKFPEVPPIEKMYNYEPLRPYFHSRKLRWSYPTMKGRSGDAWQETVPQEPQALVEFLSVSGFAGIYIDRFGYADHGAALESALREILKQQPLVSDNQRLVFYNLAEFNRDQTKKYSPGEWQRRRELALFPLQIQSSWPRGFWGFEQEGNRQWRWCRAVGELEIENLDARVRKITLTAKLAPGVQEPSRMWIEGELLNAALDLPATGAPFAATVAVPPGRHIIRFRSSAKRLIPDNGDPRDLVWMIQDFTLAPAEAP
jgi:phosphoglycerol transferase